MDFKKLMSAQISKAKSTNTAGTKYQRRADLEAERQAKYAEEQRRLEAEREQRISKKRKLEEDDAEQNAIREAKLKKIAEESRLRREAQEREDENARRKRLGLPLLADKSEGDDAPVPEGMQDIPDDELRLKLRTISQPVALFDESHTARLKRYHALTDTSKALVYKGPIPTTLEPVEEKSVLLPDKVDSTDNLEKTNFIYRQLASYFTLLLTEWAVMLSQRDEATKSSGTGRAAYNSYLTVLSDLTPMYRRMENKTVEPDLIPPLCEIVRYMQTRQYVKANDAYLTLSIGKAAWPIGVTMVGIHERSAREKLHEHDKQAHIMSDEVTRKMLQSVKRCISFAQTRWPPDDLGQLMG
jgi:pre-mRNA-splicing factor 18